MADGMKSRLVVMLLAGCCVAFTGCEALDSAAGSVREKFAKRNEARSRTFNGSPRAVFDAVKLAATNMGYRQTRGGSAQGEFDGMSAVDAGEAARSARQVGIKVKLRASLDGDSTEVRVRFTEILESDSSSRMGMATETTMQDTPLYEVFFRKVQESLAARPTAAPVAK